MINSNVQHDQIEIQKNQIEMCIVQINGWFVSIQFETPVWHNIASYIIWFDIEWCHGTVKHNRDHTNIKLNDLRFLGIG